MRAVLRRFLADEAGATAIEYGLIAAAIACVIVAAVRQVGTSLTGRFTTIANALGPSGTSRISAAAATATAIADQ